MGASASPQWVVGDKVLVNGWGLSETRWGGYATRVRCTLERNRTPGAELRRKLRQIQMERDILAKAAGWFVNKGEQTLCGAHRAQSNSHYLA